MSDILQTIISFLLFRFGLTLNAPLNSRISFRTFHYYLCLIALLASLNAWSDTRDDILSVTVFEDHERYVEASQSYGLSWQLFEIAAAHAQFELRVVPTSWQASMSRIRNEKVDMVFAALKTSEREKWATFSLPLMTESSAIFAHPEHAIDKFEDIDLEKSTIGVSAESLQEELAVELGFKNIYATERRPQLYEMLKGKRLDFLFFGVSIINYYCLSYNTQNTPQCMKQVSPDYHPDGVHAISLTSNTKASRKLAQINQAILELRHSREYKAVFSQYPNGNSLYENWLNRLDALIAKRN